MGSAAEARWIVAEAATGSWPTLLDDPVSHRAGQYFDQMVARRAAGEPLQYVLGRWAFRTLDLLVDRRVLIPRPETEQVVEVALRELAWLAGGVAGSSAAAPGTDGAARAPAATPAPGAVSAPGGPAATPAAGLVVVDLGTGSGAIALSLAAEAGPAVGAIWASDVSAGALAIARSNLAGLGGSRAAKVRLVEGWWWDALPEELRGQVSLVVSNPPYVTSAELARLPPVVADWEPVLALDGGLSGLDAIEAIVSAAPAWLARPASLVVELSPDLAQAAQALATEAGFGQVRVAQDLAGRDRALVARVVAPAR